MKVLFLLSIGLVASAMNTPNLKKDEYNFFENPDLQDIVPFLLGGREISSSIKSHDEGHPAQDFPISLSFAENF